MALFSPDLRFGWAIHVVQEVKLLMKKEDWYSTINLIEFFFQYSVVVAGWFMFHLVFSYIISLLRFANT
jgi:hypothetical protein